MRKDIFLNFIITFLTGIIGFLTNKNFALYLGVENLGLMKLFTQLLAYLNLAEIGVASASAYAFYKPLVEKNNKQVSVVLNTITSLYNKIFLFILIVGLALNPIIPFFIKNKVVDKTIYLYWSLYVVSTALNYIFAKYTILFTADQKFSLVRLIQGGSKIFCQLLQILVVVKCRSFLIFIELLILNSIIQYIFYRRHYKKYYKYIIKTTFKDKSITKNLKNLFWHKLASLVVFNTDLILISKFVSLEVVGIYASYLMVIQMIKTILNVVLNVLKPQVGKFIAEHNKIDVFNYWKKLNVLFVLISFLFSFVTYKLIDEFMQLWLGENFVFSKLTVILIIVNLFIQSFRGIIDIFKEGYGFFDDVELPIAESVINFTVSVVLVQKLGLNGVIIGTICSNILIISIAKPIVVFKKCFDKNITDYIKIYSNYILLLVVSIYSCNFIIKVLNLKFALSWIDWIVQGIIVSLITLVITFIIFLSNKEFRNFCSSRKLK